MTCTGLLQLTIVLITLQQKSHCGRQKRVNENKHKESMIMFITPLFDEGKHWILQIAALWTSVYQLNVSHFLWICSKKS